MMASIRSRLWWARYVVGSLMYLLKPTPSRIRCYFSHGTRTSWEETRFTGWKEAPNRVCLCAQIIGIAAIPSSPLKEYFYRAATIADVDLIAGLERNQGRAVEKRNQIEEMMKTNLDTFLNPACRCKLGPHWRCPLHFTWRD